MSHYTTQIRFVCETFADLDESVGYTDVNTVIEKARPKIFSFNYPIFDPAYKGVLETKILKHYYTREIGAETVGLWRLWLETTMNEIMPYFNKLYESELLEFNPFYDIDLTKDYKKQTDGNSESNEQTTSDRTTRDLYSDTPQGSLQNVENQTYLTDARKITDDNSSETTNNVTISNLDDYLEHVRGKAGQASYSEMLLEYRKTFLNIDMMVIDALKDLFFNLW